MAGFDFVIQGTAEQALDAVRAAAQAEQFEVSTNADGRLSAKKGNFGLSIVLGAFIAYCDFTFAAQPDGPNTRLTMTRNNPWWTGLIGISRVKKAATRFADGIQQSAGGRVQSRREM